MSKNNEAYFSKVIEGQEVFGLVFGHGVVETVWGDGHYTFEIEYDNGFTVPYTAEGTPGWNTGKLDFQTAFFAKDIDLMEYDFAPTDEVLSAKKIIKLRTKGKLLIKCPSGLWQPLDKCPREFVDAYLEDGKLHLFKKA